MQVVFDIVPIVIVACIVLFLVYSLHFLDEQERFVVTEDGAFQGIRGPGMVFYPPKKSRKLTVIQLGDRGTSLGEKSVAMNGASFPAEIESELESGDFVTIISFNGDKVHVSKT